MGVDVWIVDCGGGADWRGTERFKGDARTSESQEQQLNGYYRVENIIIVGKDSYLFYYSISIFYSNN